MTVKTMRALRLQLPSAWWSHIIQRNSLPWATMPLQCWLATLADAEQSPPEFWVSRLFNLIKLTGSRDQLIPNIVVQYLRSTKSQAFWMTPILSDEMPAVPRPRLYEWLLADLMRSLHLLPTVASWNKVVPISVQYPEPWIPGKITYLQF